MQTFGTCFNFEVDMLSFGQCPKTVTLNCAEMHKYVFTAIFWCNETVTFCIIEPLYCTSTHTNDLIPSS